MALHHFESVLVLAPHTDDGELGAGGFISRLGDEGAAIHYVAFSIAEASVPRGMPPDVLDGEVRAATHTLGIPSENLTVLRYPVRKLEYHRQEVLEDLVALRRSNHFDLVLLPSRHDMHQDHAVVTQEAIRAFKNTTMLGYELVWNNLTSDASFFARLSEGHIDRKAQALEHYNSQRDRPYMSKQFIFALAHTRGVQIGAEYAESFEVIRWVID